MNTNGTCDRFEREGILRLERGLSLDTHFDHCSACELAREKYEALLASLPSAQPDVSPMAGWQSRVLKATADGEAGRPLLSLQGFGRPFGWASMLAAGALAAFAVVSSSHTPQFEVQAETHAAAAMPELAIDESNAPITGEDEVTNAEVPTTPLPPPMPVAPKAAPKLSPPPVQTAEPKPTEAPLLQPQNKRPVVTSFFAATLETKPSAQEQTPAPTTARRFQVTRPDKLYGLAIKYPPAAMKAKIQGETSVQCTIRADGRNENCRIVKSLPYIDNAVIRAVEAARSEPIRVNGKAVDHSDHIWHITITLREIRDDRTSARALPTLNWN